MCTDFFSLFIGRSLRYAACFLNNELNEDFSSESIVVMLTIMDVCHSMSTFMKEQVDLTTWRTVTNAEICPLGCMHFLVIGCPF